jgi:ATP-dependent helicase HrpA
MGMQFMALGSTDELKRQIVDPDLRARLPERTAADHAGCLQGALRRSQGAARADHAGGLPHGRSVLTEWQAVTKKLPAFKAHAAAVADIEAQLKRLLGKSFVVDTPFERLQHFPRYLKAIVVRLDKLKANPARDAQLMAEYGPLWTNYERRALQLAKMGTYSIRRSSSSAGCWKSCASASYAQELRTPVPVSTKRLQKQWEGIKHG